MRHPMFIIYFLLFILTYLSINAYIFVHGYRMLDAFGISRSVYSILFILLASAYIIGEIIQRNHSSILSDVLITFGSLWFVGIVHFFFVSLGFDIIKFANSIFQLFPISAIKTLAYHTTWITVIGTVVIIVAGYINARTPVIREYTISIDKKNPVTDTLRLAIASDIHL